MQSRTNLMLVAAGIGIAAYSTCAPWVRASTPTDDDRTAVIARAAVWRPTNIRAVDFRSGPRGPGAFAPGATVRCDFVDKPLEGGSPKFACTIPPGDEVKVKYGGTNGEVYGEVLTTRLLWALGFGADRMYSVNVICHGCPEWFGGIARPDGDSRFDPAVIERKMVGEEWPRHDPHGWSWSELDTIDSERGARRMHRDALKLLAVFLQHTDSKPVQQRIVCLDPRQSGEQSCARPFLMINDVGLTFGRANLENDNAIGSVNLSEWRNMPVWKDVDGCVGNLPKSFSGTLRDPVIGESGRRFLASLLVQLSDRQLHDLFGVARVQLRLRSPGHVTSGFATIGEWVDAFKVKRQQILERRCA